MVDDVHQYFTDFASTGSDDASLVIPYRVDLFLKVKRKNHWFGIHDVFDLGSKFELVMRLTAIGYKHSTQHTTTSPPAVLPRTLKIHK
jgi:hypothetical protein